MVVDYNSNQDPTSDLTQGGNISRWHYRRANAKQRVSCQWGLCVHLTNGHLGIWQTLILFDFETCLGTSDSQV